MQPTVLRREYDSAFGFRVGDYIRAYAQQYGTIQWIKDGYPVGYGTTFRAQIKWDADSWKSGGTSVVSLKSIEDIVTPASGPRVDGDPSGSEPPPQVVDADKDMALLKSYVRRLEATARDAIEYGNRYLVQCRDLERQVTALRMELADVQAWIAAHDDDQAASSAAN